MLALVAAAALAANPTLTHQGRLLDSVGAPVDGTHTVRVELFPSESGGTSLHQEDFAVDISNGFYSVVLGRNPANLLTTADLTGPVWLEVSVDSPFTPLGPRQALTDVARAVSLLDPPQAIPSGSVQMYAGATVPAGWLPCDGSAVSRTANAALFAAIGTTYGAGDGSSTFNLPDLRGRAPVGVGQGPGLSNRPLAAKFGEESHTQTAAEVGVHTHTVGASNGTGLAVTTAGGDDGTRYGFPDDTRTSAVVMVAHGNSGGAPFNVVQPSIALQFIIKQ